MLAVLRAVRALAEDQDLAGRARKRAWSLLHIDLLALLGLSISLAFFNHGAIGISTPITYPFMLYLLVRMLLLGFGRGRPREPLRLGVPVSWLAIGVIFLVGFRVGLNVVNSNVIDVGYAGVIGANKLLHDQPLYGNWPKDNSQGDTYGPVAYFAYVPFRAIFGWSGTWDDLPAAHAAAIAFDLLTLLLLFWLGRRLRGPTLGIVLAYAWAAYPFTLWTLSSNTNDSLVALLLVAALLVITSAPARGVFAALAGLTKFAPLALAPLFLRGVGDRPPSRREAARYVLSFALTVFVVMLPVILENNWHAFWRDTIAYQAGRTSPFSVWGLWGGLGLEQHLVQGATVALGVAVLFVPRRRGVIEVAALAGAILIALQLSAGYWLYSYIVWFFPMVAVAVFGSFPSELGRAVAAAVGSGRRRTAPFRCPRRCRTRNPPLAGRSSRSEAEISGRAAGAGAGAGIERPITPAYTTPGAGSSTCSIELARIGSSERMITPFSQGSSVEVSNRIGICVTIDATACSRRTPITPPRGPVMPTSVMYAVPPGRTRASAVGTWVWVPTTAVTRPSRCQPIATFSLVASACMSTST